MQTPKHAKKIRVSVAPDAASTHQFCFSRCGDPKTNEPRPEARSRRRGRRSCAPGIVSFQQSCHILHVLGSGPVGLSSSLRSPSSPTAGGRRSGSSIVTADAKLARSPHTNARTAVDRESGGDMFVREATGADVGATPPRAQATPKRTPPRCPPTPTGAPHRRLRASSSASSAVQHASRAILVVE